MTDQADAERDALALIRASMEDDREATELILDNCDLRAVTEELAYRAALIVPIAFRGHERALAWIAAIQHEWAGEADS